MTMRPFGCPIQPGLSDTRPTLNDPSGQTARARRGLTMYGSAARSSSLTPAVVLLKSHPGEIGPGVRPTHPGMVPNSGTVPLAPGWI